MQHTGGSRQAISPCSGVASRAGGPTEAGLMTIHTNISASTFHDAIRAAGYEPPAVIEPGRITRFSTHGNPGARAGWCRLFVEGEGCEFGDWRSGTVYV